MVNGFTREYNICFLTHNGSEGKKLTARDVVHMF